MTINFFLFYIFTSFGFLSFCILHFSLPSLFSQHRGEVSYFKVFRATQIEIMLPLKVPKILHLQDYFFQQGWYEEGNFFTIFHRYFSKICRHDSKKSHQIFCFVTYLFFNEDGMRSLKGPILI